MAVHNELEKLYLSDKKEREEFVDSEEAEVVLKEHDRQRLFRVREILPQIDTSEIWNCHYLALLFQHGETTEDYENAHMYAKKAVEMGSSVTKWLYAATLDRWLVSQGKPQKFGTQFRKVNGKWELYPVDTTVTDEKRAEYGVQPLHNALKTYLEKVTIS